MRIIPVLDVMGAIVVRAVAGRRSEYRPLVSRLTASTEPFAVARALVEATGAKELYLADLDAIGGEGISTVDPRDFPVPVLLDAGLRNLDDLAAANRRANVRPVVGTETWEVPPEAWPVPFPAILSLDLFRGVMRCGWAEVAELDALPLHGVSSVIVLDIARVGLGQGSGTEELIRAIRRRFPNVELIAGGGMRTRDDLSRLEDTGADAALVASALHDGLLLGLGY